MAGCSHILWHRFLERSVSVARTASASPGFGMHRRFVLVAAGAAVIVLALQLPGCSASSPRYRSSSTKSTDSSNGDDDEIRFATKIREEESREDDRKVDVAKLRDRYSSPSLPRDNALAPPGMNRDAVLLDVVSFLGAPYAHGGASKKGVDCSGFTASVYASAAGVMLPRSAEGQFRVGREIARGELRFGDLVFFNTTGHTPSHVGIYIEDDLFAHASVTSGVTFSSLQSMYFRNRFVGARRIVH